MQKCPPDCESVEPRRVTPEPDGREDEAVERWRNTAVETARNAVATRERLEAEVRELRAALCRLADVEIDTGETTLEVVRLVEIDKKHAVGELRAQLDGVVRALFGGDTKGVIAADPVALAELRYMDLIAASSRATELEAVVRAAIRWRECGAHNLAPHTPEQCGRLDGIKAAVDTLPAQVREGMGKS